MVECAIGGCGGSPTVLASSQEGPTGIVVDAKNAYWMDADNGMVGVCAVGGCSGAPTTLASGQYSNAIAVDALNAYWFNVHSIEACTKSSSNCSPSVLATNLPQALALVVDATSNLFWTSSDGTVMKCSAGTYCGTTLAQLASGQNNPTGIAIDALNVYWTDSSYGGNVLACAKAGCGVPTTLATDTGAIPNGIAVDSSCVYWTDTNGVMKVAKP